MQSIRSIYGFTLLEVLIALSIFAISMFAVTQSVHQSLFNYQHLKYQTITSFIAENQFNLLQLLPDTPLEGEVTLLGEAFRYQLTKLPTAEVSMVKWNISISTPVQSAHTYDYFRYTHAD